MSIDIHNSVPMVRSSSEIAYEVASTVVQDQDVTAETFFGPADGINFGRLLEEAIHPDMLGERDTFIRRRVVAREAVWYAARITQNAALFEKARAQDAQGIRRRARKFSGSLALRHGAGYNVRRG